MSQANPSRPYERDWPAYFDAVADKPPRDTLVFAANRFDQEHPADVGTTGARLAVDLGYGEGRDAYELIRRGWAVVVVDSHHESWVRLQAKLTSEEADRVVAIRAWLEDFQLDWPQVDLVNASFALPFILPASFAKVWGRILGMIKSGGRFSGQLFGERDSWASIPTRSHHTREQVQQLLEGFDLEMFDEVEKDGQDVLGEPKHFHVFHIVARKK
jgi:tellurite methyltransferase